MSLIDDALQGVIVRGSFHGQGSMGKHYCELEIMTLIKNPKDPLGAIRSIHMEFCVFEGMFVQAPTLDQYIDCTHSLEVHEQELRAMIQRWNRKSEIFPLYDEPCFIAATSNDEDYTRAPIMHYDVAQVLAAATVYVDCKRVTERIVGPRLAYGQLGKRLSGLMSRVRGNTLAQTGAASLFG